MTLDKNTIKDLIKKSIENYEVQEFIVNEIFYVHKFLSTCLNIPLEEVTQEVGENIYNNFIDEELKKYFINIKSLSFNLRKIAVNNFEGFQNFVTPFLVQSAHIHPKVILEGSISHNNEVNTKLYLFTIPNEKFHYTDDKASYIHTLYKKFYSAVSQVKSSDLTTEKLTIIIKDLSPKYEAHGYFPAHHKIAGTLLKIDWNQILPLDSLDLQNEIKKIYQSSDIPGEIHRLTVTDDQYYHITKVTGRNVEKWYEFANKITNSKSHVGITGFLSSLKFFDHKHTELWVAYLANKKIDDPNEIDPSSIEIFVTVSTSKNALFTSHMGITRNTTFPEAMKHSNISGKLHAFGAKFMLDRYSEKMYMINVPARAMREIIIQELEFKNLDNKFYIGHNFNQLPDNFDTPIDAEKFYARESSHESFHTIRFSPLSEHIEAALLTIQLSKQQKLVEAGTKFSPINLTHKTLGAPKNTVSDIHYDNVFSKEYENFILINHNNQVVSTITPLQQRDEFAWFFEHPHQQFTPTKLCNSALMTFDLQALISLGEFTERIELVGTTETTIQEELS